MEVEDVGAGAGEARAYYDVVAEVAGQVAAGQADRGLLVCGMAMAIVANKVLGVYAGVCENRAAAERARSINNANVLTLGEFVTPPETSHEIVDAWLDTEFCAGWDPGIQRFLHSSLGEIRALERRLGGRGLSRAEGVREIMCPFHGPIFVDTHARPWDGVWRGQGAGRRVFQTDPRTGGVQALVKFPAGAIEPLRHHTHGH